MPAFRLSLQVAVFVFFALLCTPAGAGMQMPMLTFGQNLKPDDQKLLMQAVVKALDDGKAGASADWSDDGTGQAGRATVLRVYQQGDMPCGSVEHVFTRGGGDRYVLPFCRQTDGSWKINF